MTEEELLEVIEQVARDGVTELNLLFGRGATIIGSLCAFNPAPGQ